MSTVVFIRATLPYSRIATYEALALHYKAPVLKGPFNLEARRRAGFSEAELARDRGDRVSFAS